MKETQHSAGLAPASETPGLTPVRKNAGFAPARASITSRAATPDRSLGIHRAARELYRQYFDTIVVGADDERLRKEVFGLRYQVYCIEHPFEAPEENPEGLEQDGFDDHAVHCLLLHKGSRAWAGTVRLILPRQEDPQHSFALQDVCTDPMIRNPERFPVMQMAEVSRFCISKDFRKRQNDWLYPASNEDNDQADERRVIPNMTLGLIEGLVAMSIDNGVFYWCAVMEKPLLRLLSRLGIHFENIGPLVEYHGRRQPCMLRVDTMLERVREERPDVYEIISDGGRHSEALGHAMSIAPAV